MISVIIFTLLIAVLIFLYMRHTTRKRKKRSAELNSVRDFHASYDRVKTRRELRDISTGQKDELCKSELHSLWNDKEEKLL